jgi:6-pyruvoyltetrahydropterin/6-carboxytetrahydropterin synthase
MLVDFGDVSKALNPILEHHLDHYFLNETLPLENPTSEALARWLFEQLQPALPGLAAVVIEETCTSACRYEP